MVGDYHVKHRFVKLFFIYFIKYVKKGLTTSLGYETIQQNLKRRYYEI